MVQPLFDYRGPLGFHGHGSWSMCKAALSSVVPSSTLCDQDSSWIFTYIPNSKIFNPAICGSTITSVAGMWETFLFARGCFRDWWVIDIRWFFSMQVMNGWQWQHFGSQHFPVLIFLYYVIGILILYYLLAGSDYSLIETHFNLLKMYSRTKVILKRLVYRVKHKKRFRNS